jgi:hypothetical protein
MLTKERLAAKFQEFVRIFPGIPSYQEREGLRAQDKVIRSQLAQRIMEQVEGVNQLMAELTNHADLAQLANLDRLCRKMQRLSDTIRFASYGYGGLFAATPVDEEKLLQLYDYDLSLNRDVEELAMFVGNLKPHSKDDWQEDSLEDFRKLVSRLAERINHRKSLFSSP